MFFIKVQRQKIEISQNICFQMSVTDSIIEQRVGKSISGDIVIRNEY